MKNKKGFTLVEMLVVIALIGVVIAIAIPSITLVRKRINIRLLNEKKDEILVAAQLYGSDKKFEQDTIIKVYELLDEKYDEVAVIGDAVAPRKILTAIHEGYHAIRVME